MLLMTACGKNATAKSNIRKADMRQWAYLHNKEIAIEVFHKDGTAQYECNEYFEDTMC
ncbi:hypothetical protein [Anaerocolumna sp. MB42-C2]|uniref:hypothetical protein n=1 Tax=Anaerocolumna sp. MB42-C2 TaxID=3070997 RepID=UPI0027DF8B2A|nr:hypothetical protein [Anaerocolumna sp. MB42-C2]WMJ90023.1 hypothetical protein RBU59_10990 [Anaerocolumna sp. MB42-C2]